MPRKNTPVFKSCERCGVRFRIKPSHAARRRFCSAKCRMTRGDYICLTCGTSFVAKPSTARPQPRYCSMACHNIDRKRRCAELSPGDRAALIAKATETIRGSKRTHTDLCNRAKGKQRTAKLSGDEAIIMDAFNKAGLFPVPLYAVDKYNVDFAFPDVKLAVEYNGGNWHNSPAKRAGDAVKASFLIGAGWKLLIFDRIEKPRTNNSGNRRIEIQEIIQQVGEALDLS